MQIGEFFERTVGPVMDVVVLKDIAEILTVCRQSAALWEQVRMLRATETLYQKSSEHFLGG